MKRINRGIKLENYGLNDKNIRDIKNLPFIFELGKKIYRENSEYGIWDSYGYKHHIHSEILKECLVILKPLADRMLEESENILFNEIKKEQRKSVNFKDINKKILDSSNTRSNSYDSRENKENSEDNKESINFMTYLLECFTIPDAIQRKEGDPQIQQLAQLILGNYTTNSEEKMRIVDIGAGFGDLISAINNSGIVSKIIYIPIEIDKNKWKKIEQRCRDSKELEFIEPKDNIDNINRADLIFFVNVFHELDLSNRVSYLFNAFRLTQKQGKVIIHEVVILPRLEKNFFMWDKDDYELILSKMKVKIDIKCATTLTHSEGLPLQTICLYYKDDNLISEENIKSAIISSLEQIKNNWFNRYRKEKAKNNITKKGQRYIAFLMAQHTYAETWCKECISPPDISKKDILKKKINIDEKKDEKLTIDNNFELFYHNLTKIYRRFLFEDYNNIKIKIVSAKRDNNWNIEYILFELTTEGRNLKQITYSENCQILLYENTINIEHFFKFFLKEEKNWFFADNDLKLLFNYPISFDTSEHILMQKIESNCLRQRIECSKQIHLEYINFFRDTGTAFSYKVYDEEDFIDDNNNLIKAHKAVRDFLGYKLNSLGNPAIFISYPIESFQLSTNIDFQESMLNLSLICRINENYKDKILPLYIKEGQRKILSYEGEIIQIPYDYSVQIDISVYTRLQFGVSSSKETLFKEILNFPEVMIDELINKLKSVENNENYKKYYRISKDIIQTIGYNEDLKLEFDNLKLGPLLFGMSGTEYGHRSWILPVDDESLQNKKIELVKFLENIKKKKKPKELLQQNRNIIINKDMPELEQELSRLSSRLNIEKKDIFKWLVNFQLDEYNYALILLENLKIVNKEELKKICEKLYKKILEKFNLQDLIFVSIGGEAKSDKYISYHFRLYNEIPEEQFINQWEPKLKELNDKIIIYLDDISSTGKQLCDSWTNFSKKLKDEFIISNTFIFAPLFLTEKAKQKIEEETKFQVIFLNENLLMEKNNVLSEEAKIFKGEELKKAIEIFSKYGGKLYPKGPLGYGNSALLLVFPYNTPNNTLPVIWGQSYDINFKWTPLFPRYESKKVKNDKLMSDIEVIEEKTKDLSNEFLSIQILGENMREKDNIKELNFRIKISNVKERTIENVVVIEKAYRLDRSVLLDSSECYWNVGTIDKTLNPGQSGTIDLLTLKITNNYWHVSSSFADDFRYGLTAGPGTIESMINTVNGKKIGYDSFFPANIIFEIKITTRDKPSFTKILMFQIYNCLFIPDIFFKFNFYNKDDFLKELKIQQIVGTLSRSNLMLEPEAQHFKLLNELLPNDYEKYLQEYLDRVDKEHHQKIQERLNMIKKFK